MMENSSRGASMLRVIRFVSLGVLLVNISVAGVGMAMLRAVAGCESSEMGPGLARAPSITVNNTTDPASTSGNGFCTLREAIDNANSPGTDTTGGDCVKGTGTDTISFSVSGTITLSSA